MPLVRGTAAVRPNWLEVAGDGRNGAGMSNEKDKSSKVEKELSEEELGQVSGGQSLGEIEQRTGIDIDVAINPGNGDRVVVITDPSQGSQTLFPRPKH